MHVCFSPKPASPNPADCWAQGWCLCSHGVLCWESTKSLQPPTKKKETRLSQDSNSRKMEEGWWRWRQRWRRRGNHQLSCAERWDKAVSLTCLQLAIGLYLPTPRGENVPFISIGLAPNSPLCLGMMRRRLPSARQHIGGKVERSTRAGFSPESE